MSTLTKVFAVLLVVFCIAFSMSVMQVLVTGTNWKVEYDKSESNLKAAQASSQGAELQVKKLERLLTEVQEQRNTTVANLEKQLGGLALQLDNANTREANLQAKLTEAQAQNNTALKIAEGAQKLFETSNKQNDDLRAEIAKQNQVATALRDEKRDLERRLDTTLFQLTTSQKQVKDLQDRNTELMRRIADMGSRLTSGGGTSVVTTDTNGGGGELVNQQVGPIYGRIKSVQNDLATISVGEDDGVAKGMKFLVYRGDQLLATFVADRIQADETAGRLINVKPDANIQGGDNVLANPRLF